MKLLIIFIVLQIVNVVLQTVKSIATVKCGKVVASIVNAITFGVYTVVIIYTNCELSLWAKVAVVVATNLIGVFIVKLIEEKMRKEKVWKVEFSVKENKTEIEKELSENEISFNEYEFKNYTIFNCYCENSKKTEIVKKIVSANSAKYFATETKLL